jgi:hypothetical protein
VDVNTGAVSQLASFYAFEPSFSGGVRVAVGDIAGMGRDDIIVGADAGGGPRVRVLSLNGSTVAPIAGPLGDFFAFEPGFHGGVRVAAGNLGGTAANADDVVVAAGPGGGPRVRVLAADGSVLQDYFAMPLTSTAGVNVSVVSTWGTAQIQTDADPGDVSQRFAPLNHAAAAAALQSASPLGSAAVFSTLFANPAFTTALAANGVAPGTLFGNGVLDTSALAGPVATGFTTAITNVFGMAPLQNAVFITAFNTADSATTSPVLGATQNVGIGLFNTIGAGRTVSRRPVSACRRWERPVSARPASGRCSGRTRCRRSARSRRSAPRAPDSGLTGSSTTAWVAPR